MRARGKQRAVRQNREAGIDEEPVAVVPIFKGVCSDRVVLREWFRSEVCN
jgi:hypothetical protein